MNCTKHCWVSHFLCASGVIAHRPSLLPVPDLSTHTSSSSIYPPTSPSLAFFVAVTFTLLITEVIKNSVGRLRPDFLARCQPEQNQINNPSCNGDPAVVKEGRKSFPSGHSSLSFSGLGFLSFYLAGKIRLVDGRGYVWKVLVALLPLLGALLIAISRVDDYRHHWQDVTVGGLLGVAVTTLAYHYYYPPLHSPKCGIPYKGRYDAIEPVRLPVDLESGSSLSQVHPVASDSEELTRRSP